jgi:glutamyl-tRNA reductase
MSVHFVLFHKSGASPKDLKLPDNYWHMSTCLRSVVISESSEMINELKDYEIYKNDQAFEFLLQIICGLQSPLIGETEILGQFKNFFTSNQKKFSSNIRTISKLLLKEAKSIRTHYLQNLGCSSYGSLLRKYIPDNQETINLLGAGSLALDILPWFNKRDAKIKVYTRQVDKHFEISNISKQIELSPFASIDDNSNGILIIAAPLSSQWIKENLQLSSFTMIFDLRGDSDQDPIKLNTVFSLGQLFTDIKKNKDKVLTIKKTALSAIQDCSQKISHMEKQRPFGWEDLCQYA